MKASKEEQDETIHGLHCIGCDGKEDAGTYVFKDIIDKDGEKKIVKAKEKEHHLTFTIENGIDSGVYLAHKNLPLKGATGVVQAQKVMEVLQEYKSEDTLLAVLLDNTAVNTGYKSGIVACLETTLSRKLHLIGCSLHQNELPFRAVFTTLDGTTKSPSAFSGPLGKRASQENVHEAPIVKFDLIESEIESLDLTEEVIKDLSTDQYIMYGYWKIITTGKDLGNITSRKIGPVMHARWLTLATRLLCLYTRDANPSSVLKDITKYIVQVYTLTWFLIKRSSSFHMSPSILFQMVQQIKKQNNQVIREVCFKNLSKNSYCLLPENFLYSMLMSENLETRENALRVVKKERAAKKKTKRVTNMLDLEVNFNADQWENLINYKEATEPATTLRFDDREIEEFLMTGNSLPLPVFPSHAQSVERAVKLVSEASVQKYGLEARHKYILSKIKCRVLRPAYKTKNQYMFSEW